MLGIVEELPIYKRILDDETQINYRVGSKSGGEAVDIHIPSQKNMYKSISEEDYNEAQICNL